MNTRKIKFRGRRIDDGEWVHGSYTSIMENNRNNPFCQVESKIFHRIWQWEAGDWNMGGYANYEVIPETIGQFTGLYDKKRTEVFPKGQELYEGDIFHLGDKTILHVVEWIDSGFKGRQISNKSIVGLEYWQDRIEIIGNIHNNPELFNVE